MHFSQVFKGSVTLSLMRLLWSCETSTTETIQIKNATRHSIWLPCLITRFLALIFKDVLTHAQQLREFCILLYVQAQRIPCEKDALWASPSHVIMAKASVTSNKSESRILGMHYERQTGMYLFVEWLNSADEVNWAQDWMWTLSLFREVTEVAPRYEKVDNRRFT